MFASVGVSAMHEGVVLGTIGVAAGVVPALSDANSILVPSGVNHHSPAR